MSIFAPYLRIYFLIMSCILNIETSTDVCSMAISDSGQVIFNQEDHTGPNHAVKLGVFVDEALDFLDSHGLPLEAVAVSCGPGSYTGLRIGVSMAKGICYGRGVKLIAKVKVMLDMGAVSNGGGSFESLYGEDGKQIKFNTVMAAVNYMAKKGWILDKTYYVTEGAGRAVLHYVLVKRVKNDDEIRAGLITKEEQ